MTTVEKRYLKPEEAADYCSLSKASIYELVKKRRIPFTRIGPAPKPGQLERRRLRFDKRQLDQWLADNAVEAS